MEWNAHDDRILDDQVANAIAHHAFVLEHIERAIGVHRRFRSFPPESLLNA